jgi:hypothetical protein
MTNLAEYKKKWSLIPSEFISFWIKEKYLNVNYYNYNGKDSLLDSM